MTSIADRQAPTVELRFLWSPTDPREVAEMADHIAHMLQGLLSAGISPSIKAPPPQPVLVDANLPVLPDAKAEPKLVARKQVKVAPPRADDPVADPMLDPVDGPVTDAIADNLMAGDPDDPIYTPQEQLEASWSVLRQAYQIPKEGVQAVKSLQKAMKVTKFSDVPLSRADELFRECVAIARKLNIHVPPPSQP